MKYEFMELTRKDVIIGKRYNIDGEYRYISDGDCQSLHGWVDNAPICQYTICGNCNTKLASWAKHSKCVKCGKNIYLT